MLWHVCPPGWGPWCAAVGALLSTTSVCWQLWCPDLPFLQGQARSALHGPGGAPGASLASTVGLASAGSGRQCAGGCVQRAAAPSLCCAPGAVARGPGGWGRGSPATGRWLLCGWRPCRCLILPWPPQPGCQDVHPRLVDSGFPHTLCGAGGPAASQVVSMPHGSSCSLAESLQGLRAQRGAQALGCPQLPAGWLLWRQSPDLPSRRCILSTHSPSGAGEHLFGGLGRAGGVTAPGGLC